MNTKLIYFLAGSLGMLLQICMKIAKLKSESKAANHTFVFKDYFRNDWPAILGSLVSVAIAVVCIDELLAAKPGIENYIKWFFVFVGFTGSSIIQSVLSVTSRKIQAIVDLKTNIADGITPAVDAGNVEAVKEIKKDEEKITEIGLEK